MGLLNTEATRDPQKDDNKVQDQQFFESIDVNNPFLDYRDRANHSHETHV